MSTKANLNYATVNLRHLKAWGLFLHTYRQNRLNVLNPSMEALLLLMQHATVAEPERASLFTAL